MKLTTRLYAMLFTTLMLIAFACAGPASAQVTNTLSTLGYDSNLNPNIIVLGYTQPVRIYDKTKAVIAPTFAVTTPAAKTFTCVAATDLCTAASSGLLRGLKGQASSTTTLPAGLSGSTDYFVVYVSSTTFKLATTYANAIAGTVIDITDTGTGTHTFTPTSLAGGAVSLQGSLDGTNWFDIASSSQNVTAAGTLVFSITDTYYPLARLKFVNTAGVLTASTRYAMK